MDPIKVLIVDDSDFVRDGMKIILDIDDDFNVIGCASNGKEAVDLARKTPCDVALMDILFAVVALVAAEHQPLAYGRVDVEEDHHIRSRYREAVVLVVKQPLDIAAALGVRELCHLMDDVRGGVAVGYDVVICRVILAPFVDE